MLPLEYFQHFALFAITVRLFVSESISPSELKRGQLYLGLFCKKFGDLYSEQYMGINIHSLLHLSSCVEELGPLWVYSCFSFEGFNGILLKNIHRTQGIALQCMRTYSMTQAFPTREEIPLEGDFEELRFVKEVVGTVSLLPHSKEMRLLGEAIPNGLTSEEQQLIDTFHPESSKFSKQYLRIKKGNQIYSTLESSRSKKRSNSFVFFEHSTYS